VALELERLKSTWVNPRIVSAAEASRVLGKPIEREYTLADLLRRPAVSYNELLSLRDADGRSFGTPARIDPVVAEQVEIAVKYAGYIARQADEVARHEAHETTRIPATLDYGDVRGLSIEVRQKLQRHRPETVGQAARISGVTPAAISLLLVHLKRIAKQGEAGPLAA
jgi:tRNA uridine 5-carboxymethylaminomethyl modification enzyme